MKVAVLADTHAPRYWKACPPEVARRLDLDGLATAMVHDAGPAAGRPSSR